jgi:hypothetical protein
MINVVDGEAQVFYEHSWEAIASELEEAYMFQGYNVINNYGYLFPVENLSDVIAVGDILKKQGDY